MLKRSITILTDDTLGYTGIEKARNKKFLHVRSVFKKNEYKNNMNL